MNIEIGESMSENIERIIERFGIVDEGDIVSELDLIGKGEIGLDGRSL